MLTIPVIMTNTAVPTEPLRIAVLLFDKPAPSALVGVAVVLDVVL